MIHYAPHMLIKVKSDRIRASANGKPCTLRIASFIGLPCASSDTTVLAHFPLGGGGMATKETDMGAGYSCATCHDILDGRDLRRFDLIKEKYGFAFALRIACSMRETHAILIQEGIIEVPDGRLI